MNFARFFRVSLLQNTSDDCFRNVINYLGPRKVTWPLSLKKLFEIATFIFESRLAYFFCFSVYFISHACASKIFSPRWGFTLPY